MNFDQIVALVYKAYEDGVFDMETMSLTPSADSHAADAGAGAGFIRTVRHSDLVVALVGRFAEAFREEEAVAHQAGTGQPIMRPTTDRSRGRVERLRAVSTQEPPGDVDEEPNLDEKGVAFIPPLTGEGPGPAPHAPNIHPLSGEIGG